MTQTKKETATKTSTKKKAIAKVRTKKSTSPTKRMQTKSNKKTYQQPQGLFQTWKKVIFEPMEFYGNLPQSQGFKEPTEFMTTIFAINLGIVGLLVMLITGILTLTGVIAGKWYALGIAIGVAAYVMLLVFYIVAAYVGAAILHLLVMLFGGKQDYLETFKAVTYAAAPMVFGFIPLVGYAAALFSMVLTVMGLHKLQKLTIWRSVLVFLIPYLLFGAIYMMFMISMFFLGL